MPGCVHSCTPTFHTGSVRGRYGQTLSGVGSHGIPIIKIFVCVRVRGAVGPLRTRRDPHHAEESIATRKQAVTVQ
ncbi:protein of unknown function [Agreia sp. COWG]|nr:protein of unknown function [Agreia sp. COWG]